MFTQVVQPITGEPIFDVKDKENYENRLQTRINQLKSTLQERAKEREEFDKETNRLNHQLVESDRLLNLLKNNKDVKWDALRTSINNYLMNNEKTNPMSPAALQESWTAIKIKYKNKFNLIL
jgi:hypothetical protein